MKIVWALVALLLLGGLIVLMQPSGSTKPAPTVEPEQAPASSMTGRPAAPAGPAKVEATKVEATKVEATNVEPTNAEPTRAEPAKVDPPKADPTKAEPTKAEPTKAEPAKITTPTPPSAKPTPTPEPAKPDPSAVAAGQKFEPEIPPVVHAELIPSTFVKLPDGSISADDAWTIRGNGTAEAPYEVSWEFLASAQDTYVPRLSENKIPARIAFLSGKRVRISGYLAFPLVAQTTGECLIMLNQWDGCCIGVPPTPYDAIEVKLVTDMKGWKKHTISFGAIEGTFTVEPYLVENWLVGLYMLKDATINREL